eukprot:scaffold2901_cov91-Skeletonema_dohrnii-CCMP3373.AAC.6
MRQYPAREIREEASSIRRGVTEESPTLATGGCGCHGDEVDGKDFVTSFTLRDGGRQLTLFHKLPRFSCAVNNF